MSRKVADARLDTRTARLKLATRREPHWRSLSVGCAVGYRKLRQGGTWIARHYDQAHGRRYMALGPADDVLDADGVHVLSFAQAQKAAHAWFAELAKGDSGEPEPEPAAPYTVGDATADYLAWYRLHRKAADRVEYIVDGFIGPELGSLAVTDLHPGHIRQWFERIAAAPPRARSRPGQAPKTRPYDHADPNARRARKATANRILAVLKAALNHAYREHKVPSDAAWRAVRPFRKFDVPRVRYLSDDEARRLVNACEPDFRRLVQAALLTGARLGELRALVASDYNADARALHIRIAKSGRGRYIALSDEGQAFFEAATAGKAGNAVLFLTAAGETWDKASHHRRLIAACERASIVPPISFHELRHTYASRLAMRGVPLQVIAEQLGHADTRVTQRHYAHLSQSYVAEVIRGAAGEMGILENSKVAKMRSRKPAPSG